MGAWLSNVSLKYKFWAVNAVAFVTTLLLVLYAVYLEQQARATGAQAQAQAQAELLAAWPAGQALPTQANLITWRNGQTPQFAGAPSRPCAMARAGSNCPVPGSSATTRCVAPRCCAGATSSSR